MLVSCGIRSGHVAAMLLSCSPSFPFCGDGQTDRECCLWWPSVNICPVEKLGLAKDLVKVILVQDSAQQVWQYQLSQVVNT